MKKMCLLILLAALSLAALPAHAQDVSLPPYTICLPEGATLVENEGSVTCVSGNTRVVMLVISRVPDEYPAAALPRLMEQFDPLAVFGADIPLRDGFTGLLATTANKYGEGINLTTAMVLHDGELLILSGYDMTGDDPAAAGLLTRLLEAITVDGAPILLLPQEE